MPAIEKSGDYTIAGRSGPSRLPRGSIVFIAAVVCMVAVSAASADDAQASPQVTVTHADGPQYQGELDKIGDGTLTLLGEHAGQFPLSDLISIEFPASRLARSKANSVLQLANGDRLLIDPKQIDNTSLTGTWTNFPSVPPVAIPLEMVRSLGFPHPTESILSSDLSKSLSETGEGGDRLVLKTGDRISGEMSGLDGDQFLVHTAAGDQKVPRADVRQLILDPELISFPESAPKDAVLTFVDGSRLTGGNVRLLDDGRLSFVTAYGELAVPPGSIASLRVLGGRAVYLSDVEPQHFESTPYLATKWPLARDRSVNGSPLVLRGTEYIKGLGMHSKSSATYQLGGEFRRFQATIGIDDTAMGQGSVIFSVDVDGRSVFTSDLVNGQSPIERIGPIDVSGAKLLTLTVDFADFGDIQDCADWCDALLIK